MIWLLISTSYVVKSNKLIHFDKYDSKLDEYKEKYYPLVTHYDVFDIEANELYKIVLFHIMGSLLISSKLYS